VRNQEPVPPSRLRKGVPLDLETICLKCLAKEPEKRYASAAELADELLRYQYGEPVLARPVGRLERGWRWCKRNPAVAALLAAVVLTLTTGIAVASVLAWVATEARSQAEDDAKTAKKERAEAVAARNDLEKSNDQLLTTAAQGLLRPLAAQAQPNQPLPPLNEQEIEPLWELATSANERLRLRFVEAALHDRVLLLRLTDRRSWRCRPPSARPGAACTSGGPAGQAAPGRGGRVGGADAGGALPGAAGG